MTDNDLELEDTEQSLKDAAYFEMVRTVLHTAVSIDKQYGMGAEYLYSFLVNLGVNADRDTLAAASWSAMCEWDL